MKAGYKLHEGWVNIFRIPVTDEEGETRYQTMSGNIIYKTREEAQKKDGHKSIDIIKIQWRE